MKTVSKLIPIKLFLSTIFLTLMCSSATVNSRLSLHLEHSTLNKGKKIVVQCDIFYSLSEDRIVTHYTYPDEIIFIYNKSGETKLYVPKTNEVVLKYDQVLATRNTILYIFVQNQIQDMGLKEAGYKMIKSGIEDNFYVSYWDQVMPDPNNTLHVKIVAENYLPVFMEYTDKSDKAVKRTYYDDYQFFNNFSLPQRITDVDYLPNGDSLITRMIYSDFKTDENANSQYFNFTIPSDAKIKE